MIDENLMGEDRVGMELFGYLCTQIDLTETR